jgi:DNA-binding MarR family transcriptional regulator
VRRRSVLLDLAVTNAFVSQLFDQEMQRAGIKPAQLGTLTMVQEAEPVTPTELERISGSAGGTLRDRIRQLLREGLVERRPHETDARSYHLVTTADGRAVLDRARPVLRRVERLLEHSLGDSLEEHRVALNRLQAAAQESLEGTVRASAGTRTAGPW